MYFWIKIKYVFCNYVSKHSEDAILCTFSTIAQVKHRPVTTLLKTDQMPSGRKKAVCYERRATQVKIITSCFSLPTFSSLCISKNGFHIQNVLINLFEGCQSFRMFEIGRNNVSILCIYAVKTKSKLEKKNPNIFPNFKFMLKILQPWNIGQSSWLMRTVHLQRWASGEIYHILVSRSNFYRSDIAILTCEICWLVRVYPF